MMKIFLLMLDISKAIKAFLNEFIDYFLSNLKTSKLLYWIS